MIQGQGAPFKSCYWCIVTVYFYSKNVNHYVRWWYTHPLIFVNFQLEHPVKPSGINCSIFKSIMHIFVCDNTKKSYKPKYSTATLNEVTVIVHRNKKRGHPIMQKRQKSHYPCTKEVIGCVWSCLERPQEDFEDRPKDETTTFNSAIDGTSIKV